MSKKDTHMSITNSRDLIYKAQFNLKEKYTSTSPTGFIPETKIGLQLITHSNKEDGKIRHIIHGIISNEFYDILYSQTG